MPDKTPPPQPTPTEAAPSPAPVDASGMCGSCGGRGNVAFATEVVTCSTCGGTGTVDGG